MLRFGVVVEVMCGGVRQLLLLGYGGVFRFRYDLFLIYLKEIRGVEWFVQGVGVCGWNGWNYLWDVVVKVVFMGLDGWDVNIYFYQFFSGEAYRSRVTVGCWDTSGRKVCIRGREKGP